MRCGVILCGGRGHRLGGVDKPLLEWCGRPLVDQVLERLAPQVDLLCISANRNFTSYGRRAPVVSDGATANATAEPPAATSAATGFDGPLAGILAAARWFRTQLSEQQTEQAQLFVCPGDSPRIPKTLVAHLAAQAGPVVCAHDGERLQPLHLRVALPDALALATFLHDGGRSVRGWLEAQNATLAQFADPAAFLNLNDPVDFEATRPPVL